MNDDLISVMIPCYESSKTLAKALASLMLQSHKNWEALVVDDGSTDHPEKIIQFFKDSRIRYFRLPENRGRAYARQVALDSMRGDFLTMLDADDWILPNKLNCQLDFLKSNSSLALVSGPVFLVNSNDELVGVECFKQKGVQSFHQPLRNPQPLPLAHAPILVRSEFVKGRHYDINLKYSEDLDFFLPILLEQSYGIMSEAYYVYSFEGNKSLEKLRAQLQIHKVIFRKFIKTYPFVVSFRICFASFKILLSKIGFVEPFLKWRHRRKIEEANEQERLSFKEAYQDIFKFISKIDS